MENIIGNFETNKPTVAYFNTNTPYINVPEDFFLMLIDGFFDIHHNMKCFSHKNLTMKFVLEGNFFELTTEEMFRCDGSGLCYSIVRHKSDDSNTWVLVGYLF